MNKCEPSIDDYQQLCAILYAYLGWIVIERDDELQKASGVPTKAVMILDALVAGAEGQPFDEILELWGVD